MESGLEDSVAVVTASSRGLGRAAATALVGAGAHVVVNGRDGDRLEETVTTLAAAGPGDAVGVAGDITDAETSDRLIETAIDEFGQLDTLVTSAGGPPSGPFESITDAQWYDAYDQLVMSVVRTVRVAAPHLRASEVGSITMITSRAVKEAQPRLVLSNAVRMAVLGLSKTLSHEFGPAIRVNSVLPGFHATSRIEELTTAAVERGEYPSVDAAMAARGESNPLGRVGDPSELGETVAFLSSPRASYITGVALPVDGGATGGTL
jgi:3-oxoacyl-[acyl-carrier protein] reductase